ncbi:GTP-binding protein Rhes [Ctenocephalides felis]|uniref:GTP-binding protein Rhes n=1 Tax=Ctenocephalides felis TaxID=7515 RepID=UPI000E6E586E|nr:GTP-binding protein Rhes [Ctenocephalides felis]
MPGPRQRLRLLSLSPTPLPNTPSRQPKRETHRIVLLGAAKVGKSSIVSQFLYDKTPARYKETVEEMHRGEYSLPHGDTLTLDILDTSGAMQFPAMRRLSIAQAGAFMLVYSLDNEQSWCEVRELRDQIIDVRGTTSAPIVVVANKCDLLGNSRVTINDNRDKCEKIDQKRKTIDREKLEEIERVVKDDWSCGYAECSAKTGEGVVGAFKELLLQAKVSYNLSPAVRRRRQSLPAYMTERRESVAPQGGPKHKRHSCTVA